MKYLSVCSGIEAASVAWQPLGWEAVAFSEIEKYPSAVLAHHYPSTPNLGDMTKIRDNERYNKPGTADLLVGGTPCQSFSIAGLRGGMDDERGNLSLEFCRLAAAIKPRWIVWEHVPGVLSSTGGRDGGPLRGAMAELGYGLCWRVLDAQHFGVPQRRRRVFVVGYLGDWRPAAAVLFEQESLRGNTAKGDQERKDASKDVAGSLGSRGLRSHTELDGHGAYIVKKQAGCPGSGSRAKDMMTARMRGFGDYVEDATASAAKERDYKDATDLVVYRKSRRAQSKDDHETWVKGEYSNTLNAFDDAGDIRATHAVAYETHPMTVRRLTPIECERLQGFPDNYTRIPWRGKPAEECPDGNRYRAIGNSMAVPVMAWIGERIKKVAALLDD